MSNTLENIILSLQHTQNMQKHIAENNLTTHIRHLQAWQTKRLLVTHDDLWQSKRFKPAMQFFIDELYGPKDFSQRDNELARVVPKMAKLLPDKALLSLQAALKLNALSLELDLSLIQDLGKNTLDHNSYFASYKACNNQTKREEQIQLLENLGLDLAQVVKISGISAILMLSRKPAKVAGVKSLHEFLEKGFKSFKKLGNVHDFINPIILKERKMMLALFENDENDNPLPKVN
ncbi:FFLEELY motif protein [Glaciecola petra]|uniref:DUF8198 domain-containing protein n=1 Tax=Glaciecola petra TaxID=3075602 RepID=A0ABU2ZP47_9ALTE|nr:hypothetical protein [Aestuariibacter sp. P117]MDT0594129.1 hypothetical protein [Aestuariibacter sp. P117]